MNYQIEDRQIRMANGNVATFEFAVQDVLDVDHILVVMLEVPRGRVMTENVFGVSDTGAMLWQIERIPETATDPTNRYVQVTKLDSNCVRVANWNGDVLDVDIHTGHVKKRMWLK